MKKLKIILLPTLILSSMVLADQSLSMRIRDNIFRIQVGEQEAPKTTIKELQQRIWMLERAVEQLQNEVFRFSDSSKRGLAKAFFCYLDISSGGTFGAKGETPNEAKVKVLKACRSEGHSFECKEQSVKCDDNDVFHLPPRLQKEPAKTFSCYLDTPFKGTFTKKGETVNEARGEVLKACKSSGGGIFCKEQEIQCGE